jgi:hypothetical protein
MVGAFEYWNAHEDRLPTDYDFCRELGLQKVWLSDEHDNEFCVYVPEDTDVRAFRQRYLTGCSVWQKVDEVMDMTNYIHTNGAYAYEEERG